MSDFGGLSRSLRARNSTCGLWERKSVGGSFEVCCVIFDLVVMEAQVLDQSLEWRWSEDDGWRAARAASVVLEASGESIQCPPRLVDAPRAHVKGGDVHVAITIAASAWACASSGHL